MDLRSQSSRINKKTVNNVAFMGNSITTFLSERRISLGISFAEVSRLVADVRTVLIVIYKRCSYVTPRLLMLHERDKNLPDCRKFVHSESLPRTRPGRIIIFYLQALPNAIFT